MEVVLAEVACTLSQHCLTPDKMECKVDIITHLVRTSRSVAISQLVQIEALNQLMPLMMTRTMRRVMRWFTMGRWKAMLTMVNLTMKAKVKTLP